MDITALKDTTLEKSHNH